MSQSVGHFASLKKYAFEHIKLKRNIKNLSKATSVCKMTNLYMCASSKSLQGCQKSFIALLLVVRIYKYRQVGFKELVLRGRRMNCCTLFMPSFGIIRDVMYAQFHLFFLSFKKFSTLLTRMSFYSPLQLFLSRMHFILGLFS